MDWGLAARVFDIDANWQMQGQKIKAFNTLNMSLEAPVNKE